MNNLSVSIINQSQVSNILQSWGEFAATCYNTNPKHAQKIGAACLSSSHFSGSRTNYIVFKIDNIDRGTAEQLLRHEIGVRPLSAESIESSYDINPTSIVKNMKSFRYVDMKDFDYTVPDIIQRNPEALAEYHLAMDSIKQHMSNISNILESTPYPSKAKLEATQYLLPRATHTSVVVGFTIEALIQYLHKRLCVRTQPEHRKLAIKIKECTLEHLPVLQGKLQAHCDYLLFCPEGSMCCGKYPTREEIIERR